MMNYLSGVELGNVVPGAQILEANDLGVNETFLGSIRTATEEHRAYIKVLDDKQLVNELLACVLGRSMGFPVPEGFLLQARSSDLPDSIKLKQKPGQEQFVFGSKASGAPSLYQRFNKDWPSAIEFLKKNRFERWSDVTVFDDWIANGDRHAGNLLIEPGNKIWWIDHGHGFTGPKWTENDLDCEKMYKNQIASHIAQSLTSKEKTELINKVQELSGIMEGLALQDVEVASHIGRLLAISDLEAIVRFVAERVAFLHPIMQERLQIPRQPALFLLP